MKAHVPPRVIRWESLTQRAFDELERSRCVVIATGSPLEVHGPHLPLGADFRTSPARIASLSMQRCTRTFANDVPPRNVRHHPRSNGAIRRPLRPARSRSASVCDPRLTAHRRTTDGVICATPPLSSPRKAEPVLKERLHERGEARSVVEISDLPDRLCLRWVGVDHVREAREPKLSGHGDAHL